MVSFFVLVVQNVEQNCFSALSLMWGLCESFATFPHDGNVTLSSVCMMKEKVINFYKVLI